MKKILTVSLVSLALTLGSSGVGSAQTDVPIVSTVLKILTVGQILALRMAMPATYQSVSIDDRFGTVSIREYEAISPVGKIYIGESTYSNLRGFDLGSTRFGGQIDFHRIKFNIRQSNLPPDVISQFRSANISEIIADGTLEFEYDIGSSDLKLALFLSLDEGGTIAINSTLTNVFFGIPDIMDVQSAVFEGNTPESNFNANVANFEIGISDRGLTEKIVQHISSSTDTKPSKVRRNLSRDFSKLLGGLFSSSEIAADTKANLDELIKESVAKFRQFVEKPTTLEISFLPEDPVNIRELEEIVALGEIDLLGMSISKERPEEGDRSVLTNSFIDDLQKDETGKVDLARRLILGIGIPQDFGRAHSLLSSGTSVSDPDASLLMAQIYAKGLGVQKDTKTAYRRALNAAALGNSNAVDMLNSLERGLSNQAVGELQATALSSWLSSNRSKTLEQLKKRALNGEVVAIRKLSRSFFDGVGAPRNYREAYAWSNVGAAAGDRMSRSIRDRLLSAPESVALAAKQLSDAQSLSSKYWTMIQPLLSGMAEAK
jgi:TPR repeat protein